MADHSHQGPPIEEAVSKRLDSASKSDATSRKQKKMSKALRIKEIRENQLLEHAILRAEQERAQMAAKCAGNAVLSVECGGTVEDSSSKCTEPKQEPKEELDEETCLRLIRQIEFDARFATHVVQAKRTPKKSQKKKKKRTDGLLDEETGLNLIDRITAALHVYTDMCDFCCRPITEEELCSCGTVAYCSKWCRETHLSIHRVLCADLIGK